MSTITSRHSRAPFSLGNDPVRDDLASRNGGVR